MDAPGPPQPGARARAGAFLALALAAALAVWRQDFGGALPLGLVNDGRAAWAWLAGASLAAALGAAALFAAELASGRGLRPAAAARAMIGAFLVFELLVTALDVLVVSRSDGRGPELGGPYRELVGRGGTRVFLKRPHPGSPLGFRSASPAPRETAGPRLLFLGDSYTEGSGRDAACNYPEVAVAQLNALRAAEGAAPFELLNAGVAGYGPASSLALLRFLREEGYRFDAVVLSLFLENDFTDDLPATERRVVAGMSFRFPSSPWLRWLHPLNTRSARYALFLWQASRIGRADDYVQRGDGRCRPPPPLPAEVPAPLRDLVLRRLADNYGPEPRLATDGVADVLRAFAETSHREGLPVVVAVFPDRILADSDLRDRLGVADLPERADLGRLRRFVADHAAGLPVVDLTGALTGGSLHYRPSDTHLSDPGNVTAAHHLATALTPLLR